jgi:hypothetical protein
MSAKVLGQKRKIDEVMEMAHPLYGLYTCGFKIINEFPNYEINEECIIRVITTGIFLKPAKNYQVVLTKNKKRYSKLTYRLALSTFFPQC